MEYNMSELQMDLEEVVKLEAIAQRERTKARLAVWKSEIEQEIKSKETVKKQAESSQPISKSPPKPKLFTKKIKTYAWDQSDKFVKIYVSTGLKGVGDIPKEDVSITKEDNHYKLNINNLSNSNHELTLPKLLHEVKEPNVRIKTDEVVIMLKKASPKKWETLSEIEKKEKDEKFKPPPEMGKNEDPGKGIMDMMKKMYDEGDDDMKRTIAKAWTESRDKQERGEGFGM